MFTKFSDREKNRFSCTRARTAELRGYIWSIKGIAKRKNNWNTCTAVVYSYSYNREYCGR